jgi:hypothetical protein
MKYTLSCIVILFVALALNSCSPSFYTPTAKTTSDPKLLADLSSGRALYLQKCGKCHKLHSPKQYNAEKWQHNLEKMQPKARISNDEKALIYAYLTNDPKAKK